MKVGVVKEIKTREYRVGLVPAGVKTLVNKGHTVFVEKGAGEGSGISDDTYLKSGAKIVSKASDVWNDSELIIKVKEPLESEYQYFKEGQILYTYLHLAADLACTKALMEKKVSAVAYETIQLADNSLPLLKPMSQVAGRMSIQVGAAYLEKEKGGKGILLGGVPGTRKGRVTIIGAGTVGTHAARIAVGMGAEVTILDVNLDRLNYLEEIFGTNIKTLYSDPLTVAETVRWSDLVVGAVLIPGAKAPKLVTEELIKEMEAGSVVVDVAVDQGGCIETCRPTTHDNPTYEIGGVVHYCVANMPGAVARTSTYALTAATIGFCAKLADMGFVKSVTTDQALAKGVNVYKGKITCKPVGEAHNLPYSSLKDLL